MFGRCRHGATIDREVRDLADHDLGLPGERMFTYMRYNAELTAEALTVLGLPVIRPDDGQKMDSVDHIAELQKIGQKVAERDVESSHFEGFL